MHKSLIIAAALLVAPAVSQAKTLDELLVEKGVITKGADSGASNSSASKLYWNKGTRASYTDIGFEAGFALFNQFRYTYFDNDTEETGERDRSSFDVEKARLIISGTAMHNEFSYYTQVDFVGNSDDDGEKSPELKDAYITWHACDWADIGMGQRKTLLSRQYNTTDWKTQFPDRSEASDFFDLGRQAGLWTALTNEENNFTLSAAMYNGESDGVAVISENSLVTGLPSTLLPYANFFVGFGNPQPLVDGNGASGVMARGNVGEDGLISGYVCQIYAAGDADCYKVVANEWTQLFAAPAG
ncbi:MAG: hypothetical protein DCC75_11000, partial [Proteobacteria bacterium]